MRGLIYKDIQLLLNRISTISRALLIIALLLISILTREPGTIFLLIVTPIALASVPASLLVADYENGWSKFAGIFPISKVKIVLSRYIFCISLIIIPSVIILSLSMVNHFVFNRYSLTIHLIIGLVGLLLGIIYVLLSLPAIYAFGSFGNTLVNVVVLSCVMIIVYCLQKTNLGLILISWLNTVNVPILIGSLIVLVAVLAGISLKLSVKIYCRTFYR